MYTNRDIQRVRSERSLPRTKKAEKIRLSRYRPSAQEDAMFEFAKANAFGITREDVAARFTGDGWAVVQRLCYEGSLMVIEDYGVEVAIVPRRALSGQVRRC